MIDNEEIKRKSDFGQILRVLLYVQRNEIEELIQAMHSASRDKSMVACMMAISVLYHKQREILLATEAEGTSLEERVEAIDQFDEIAKEFIADTLSRAQ